MFALARGPAPGRTIPARPSATGVRSPFDVLPFASGPFDVILGSGSRLLLTASSLPRSRAVVVSTLDGRKPPREQSLHEFFHCCASRATVEAGELAGKPRGPKRGPRSLFRDPLAGAFLNWRVRVLELRKGVLARRPRFRLVVSPGETRLRQILQANGSAFAENMELAPVRRLRSVNNGPRVTRKELPERAVSRQGYQKKAHVGVNRRWGTRLCEADTTRSCRA